MAYSNGQIEDLRDRADIVSLVSRRVTLRKSGKDFAGLCPFHGEKTPSFYVVPNKHLWHCFGCGETGDVFKFFMKLDGMPFVDALQLVARESGVILADEQHDPEEARRRAHQDELAALVERAVKFYEQKLWHPGGQLARDHLVQRGVKEETARRFQLGFGGAGRNELRRALEKASAPVDLAIEAGLLGAGERGAYDRFSTRLIVPIRVPRPPNGRAVTLGGRALDGLTPGREGKKPAKYLNGPESPLYQKGSVLFGLDLARDHIRRADKAVVVEGYFDVIGLHQAGLPLAVASCGTSLTAGHLDLLVRTGAREIVFLFDGDEAGGHAAERAAELCAKALVPAKVATLPQGVDPDEFARARGQEGLLALLERARPAIEFLIEQALSALGPAATVEERVRAVEAVRPVVLAAPEGLSRELYVAQIAERLQVTREVLHGVLEKGGSERRPPRSERASDAEVAFGPLATPPKAGRSSPGKVRPNRLLEAERRTAERTYPSEEFIAVALLRFPRALGAEVAREGILGDFGHPELRALGEAVIAAQAQEVELSAEALLAGVEDEKLRGRLRHMLAEDDATLDQAAGQLTRVLDKLRLKIRENRTDEMLGKAGRGELPQGDAALRAFEEDQQQRLEESRAVHRRIRERDRGA